MLKDYLAGKALGLLGRPEHGFGPAAERERTVFGARRPGFPLSAVPDATVSQWVEFMRAQGVRRVVCLLPERQLAHYTSDLLAHYAARFGREHVLWVPTDDFTLVDTYRLVNVLLPFLFRAERDRSPAVVHCSGGVGRTGHVLAAWLAARYGLANEQAIAAVRRTGRNPRESRDPRLDGLLDTCRQVFARTDHAT